MTKGIKILCAAAAAIICAGAAQAALFEPLLRFTKVSGDVRVFKPGAAESVPAVNMHAYPYGSRIVVPKWDGKPKSPKPSAQVYMSNLHRIDIAGGTELVVTDAAVNPLNNKVIELRQGMILTVVTVSTVRTGTDKDKEIEEGINALSVKLPNDIVVTRITDRSTIAVSHEGGNATIKIAPEGQTMEIAGPQFRINSIGRNSEIEIFGQKDFTHITGHAGEFTCVVDKGVDNEETVKFRKNSAVKIWRTYAKVGGRMAVAVMVIAPNGAMKSYAFLEGQTGAGTTSDPAGAGEDFPEADGGGWDTGFDTGTEATDTGTGFGGFEGFDFW